MTDQQGNPIVTAADLQAQVAEACRCLQSPPHERGDRRSHCRHSLTADEEVLFSVIRPFTADTREKYDWPHIADRQAVKITLAVSAHVAQVREGLADEIEFRCVHTTDGVTPCDRCSDAARIVRPSVGPREQRSDFAGEGKSEGHTDSQSRIGAGGGS